MQLFSSLLKIPWFYVRDFYEGFFSHKKFKCFTETFPVKTKKETFLQWIWLNIFFFLFLRQLLKEKFFKDGHLASLEIFGDILPGLQLLLQEDQIHEQNTALQIVVWSIWKWNPSVNTSVVSWRMKCVISVYLCGSSGFPKKTLWNPMSHFSHSWESVSLGKIMKKMYYRGEHELFITFYCAWAVHETNT